MNSASKRIKRSEDVEVKPVLRVGNFKKQRLDVDENWYKKHAIKKRITDVLISYGNDALNHSNPLDENINPDHFEILFNAKTFSIKQQFNETTIVSKVESNISRDLINEKQKKALEDEILTVDNQTNVDKFTVESLELDEKIAENWKNVEEETENEENSQFEIISTNKRINPQLFDDPTSFKRKPLGNRVSKKYFSFLEKPAKDTREIKRQIKSEIINGRFKRSANDPNFTRYEKLDEDGNVILEWDPSYDKEVTFRVTAKTLGYVGIGFNEKSNMKGADILLVWVDDHTGAVNLLVNRSFYN